MKTALLVFLIGVRCLLAAPASASPPQACAGGQAYDDGSSEFSLPAYYVGPVTQYFVSRFTPPSQPYAIERVCVYVNAVGSGTNPFDVVVFDDDGSGGSPGSLLSRVPMANVLSGTPQWLEVDLGGCLHIASGSLWIGLSVPFGSNARLGVDRNLARPYRWLTWDFGSPGPGAAWSSSYYSLGAAAFMVRAVGSPGGSAAATLRSGSGLNPPCYSAAPPSIGSPWSAQVSHAPLALQTRILFYSRPASGPALAFGEILVELTSARLFTSVVASTGTVDSHSFLVPDDPTLIGLTLATQALAIEPGRRVLCNAIDLTIGC